MSEERILMVQSNPEVAKLNRVPGFDPVRLLWKAAKDRDLSDLQTQQLVLKYKKLWFRMACPNGRLHLIARRLTDQMAIIEAEIYRDRKDEHPMANFISTRSVNDTPGGFYTQAAEYEAQDNVLTDAGFGIQLCDVLQTIGEETYTPKCPGQSERGQAVTERSDTTLPDMESPRYSDGRQDTAGSKQAEKEIPVAVKNDCTVVVTNGQMAKPTKAPVENQVGNVENTENLNAGEQNAVLSGSGEPEGHETMDEPAGNTVFHDETVKPTENPIDNRSGDTSGGIASNEAEPSAATATEKTEGLREEEQAASQANEKPDQELPLQSVRQASSSAGGMTLEDAKNVVVDFGISKGKTLEEIGSRRPAALRWFFTTCPNSSEELKTAARLVYDSYTQEKTV